LSDLKSTKPLPIKVTDQIPTSDDKADKKAVEIAKTGKVTTVVAVMHLYSDSKSEDAGKRLLVKQKTIRVLLDTGSSRDLLFLKKGSNKNIPIVNRAVPKSWGTSNGTFITKKVGEIELSFVVFSISKRAHLRPDIVEYPAGGPKLLYDLIIGKQTLHDIGAVLDFKEKTITIDDILLPMRNINNLQLKSSISRAFKLNANYAQELESTRNATKRVIEILDAKYGKADHPRTIACT
jgi:hypothetical protein